MKKQMVISILSIATFILLSAPMKSELYIEESKPIHKLPIYISPPLINQREAWIHHMYFKESSCDWTEINKTNHIGGWQFGQLTLKRLGYKYITPSRFRKNPNIFPLETQLKVINTLIEVNEIELSKNFKCYPVSCMDFIDVEIKGVRITKAGLLAGAHLGGVGNVRLFLISNGMIDKNDGYTRISDYIKEFQIFDI